MLKQLVANFLTKVTRKTWKFLTTKESPLLLKHFPWWPKGYKSDVFKSFKRTSGTAETVRYSNYFIWSCCFKWCTFTPVNFSIALRTFAKSCTAQKQTRKQEKKHVAQFGCDFNSFWTTVKQWKKTTDDMFGRWIHCWFWSRFIYDNKNREYWRMNPLN